MQVLQVEGTCSQLPTYLLYRRPRRTKEIGIVVAIRMHWLHSLQPSGVKKPEHRLTH